MNLGRRAFLGITHNFYTSILLFAAIFVLGSIVTATLFARQTIVDVDTEVRSSLAQVVTVAIDHVAMAEHEFSTGQWPEPELITLETLHEIAALLYLRNYDVFTMTVMLSKDLEWIAYSRSEMGWFFGQWTMFALRGVSSTNLLDIEEGLIEIVSGRMFTEDEIDNSVHVVLISEDFAQFNNLDIGSTFTLNDIHWDKRDLYYLSENDVNDFYVEENIFAQRDHCLEVVGIFSPLLPFSTGREDSDAEIKERFINQLYVPHGIVTASNIFDAEQQREMGSWIPQAGEDMPTWLMFYHNVYALNNFDYLDDFTMAVQAVAPEFWTVMQAGEGYDFSVNSLKEFAASIEAVASLLNIILLAALIATAVGLSLLAIYLLRSRKREIGIYLVQGENRSKIVLQMMIEILTMALIAIVFSIAAGSMLSDSILEQVAQSNFVATQPNMDDVVPMNPLGMMGFGAHVPTLEEALAAHDAGFTVAAIVMAFIATISTVLIATILPMLYIVRLNPKKIML